jgi:hypothetical protein
MTFCNIVGHASRHTAGPIAPSTIERSKLWELFGPRLATLKSTGASAWMFLERRAQAFTDSRDLRGDANAAANAVLTAEA